MARHEVLQKEGHTWYYIQDTQDMDFNNKSRGSTLLDNDYSFCGDVIAPGHHGNNYSQLVESICFTNESLDHVEYSDVIFSCGVSGAM